MGRGAATGMYDGGSGAGKFLRVHATDAARLPPNTAEVAVQRARGIHRGLAGLHTA